MIKLENLDEWQKEILAYRGDILLCKGRRIGGTEIFAIKAAERMVSDPGTKIVMTSLTEDQAQLIVSVALEHLEFHYKKLIAKGKDKPTQNKIKLINKSRLMVRPVGNMGSGIRGFDGDILGIDEAPWQPKQMWRAARPVITTNAGEIWMWGTPAEKDGYFWEQYDRAYNKKDKEARFKVWHKSSEEVLLNRPISANWTEKQKEGVIRILAEEKRDMSAIEYGNEYLGEFLNELRAFFEPELIERCCILKRPEMALQAFQGKNYLGVDIARMGNDESTFEIVSEKDGKYLHLESQITKKTWTTTTEKKIMDMAILWKVKKIGIDAGAGTLGVSILDHLLETPIKHKVMALNNRALALDKNDKPKKQKLFKEDMYNNLKSMMEHGELFLLDDDNVKLSLKSVQYDFSDQKGVSRMVIFGNYTHVVEGLMRAAWLAKKEKTLNLWAA